MAEHCIESKITAEISIIVVQDRVETQVHDGLMPVNDLADALSIRMFGVIESIVIQLGDIRIDCIFERNPVIQEFEINVSVAEESEVLDKCILLIENLNRVMERKPVSTTDIIISIRFIYTVIRPLLQSTPDNHSSGIRARHLICLHVVRGHVRTYFKPFCKIVLYLGFHIELVQFVGLDDTFLVIVVRANVEIGGFVTSGEGCVCIVADSKSGDGTHPIHIRQCTERIINVSFIISITYGQAILLVIVVNALIICFHIEFRIRHLDLVDVRELRNACADIDTGRGLSRRTGFGGDENDTVAGAGTVDCCGCRVLEHIYRFYIADIEDGQGTHILTEVGKVCIRIRNRHTVNHIERLITCVERRNSADDHTLT